MLKFKGGYKYQLTETASVHVNMPDTDLGNWIQIKDKVLTVHRGYAWDGPSGPTIDTMSFMRGSLFHDALYQLIREKRLPPTMRKHADELMYRICLEDGMWSLRAWWCYKAVRIFGGKHANG